MLTGITAAMTNREVQTAAQRPTTLPVALSFYKRLDECALHSAKRTRDGLPTPGAILDRSWYETHCEPGWFGWETSFSNVCQMLGWDESQKRRERLAEITRAWQKALCTWGRRRRDQMLEDLLALKATDNPRWIQRHAVQAELPMPEEAVQTGG